MAYSQAKRPVLNFEPNAPVSVTLDTDPSSAKAMERVSKAGKPYTMYVYYTADGKVFFAMSDLHRQLLPYKKGETVTIVNELAGGARYGKTKVVSNDVGGVTPTDQTLGDIREEIAALRASVDILAKSMQAVIDTVNPPIKNDVPKEEPKVDVAALDF